MFQERRHELFSAFVIALGCFNLLYGLLIAGALPQLYRLMVIGLGIWLLLGGSAGLIPQSHARIADVLRIGSYVAFGFAVIVGILGLAS